MLALADAVKAHVTDDEIAAFYRDGHLSMAPLTTFSEINRLREVYDRLFAERRGWDEGDLTDFAVTETAARERPSVPQLLNPSRYEPWLTTLLFRRNALLIARQLLGPSAELVFEHAMLKPARTGGATPWHQDEAFYEKYTNYKSITFWMPLQDVDEFNGCMHFIPGSHAGVLLPHRSVNNDPRIHGLETLHVDPHARITSAPLRCGEVSVHHALTLHAAGPNQSDQPRRAYALGFGVRSRKHTLRVEHPWNAEKMSDRMMRTAAGQNLAERGLVQLKSLIKAMVR